MEQQLTAVLQRHLRSPRCRHDWVVENPNGPTSRVRCTSCGEEKDLKHLLGDCLRDGQEEHLVCLKRSGQGERLEKHNRDAIVRVECLLDLIPDLLPG